MSDSLWPHRQQPTRLPCPWDSPSKNTGVGCHFLLQYMKVKSESEVAQYCPTLSNPMDCSPPGSPIHGISQARVLEWGAIAFSKKSIIPYLIMKYLGQMCKLVWKILVCIRRSILEISALEVGFSWFIRMHILRRFWVPTELREVKPFTCYSEKMDIMWTKMLGKNINPKYR